MRRIILAILYLVCSGESLSSEFPSVEETMEFGHLCDEVYKVKNCTDLEYPNVECHWYKDLKDGTQVMMVSSNVSKYVGAVYAGTDSWKDIFTDVDIRMSYFGPEDDPIDASVRVHKGFNHAVFSNGVFDDILSTIQNFLEENPDYKVMTSGHSLGGAESILTAVGLAHSLPDQQITSITYGTPRIGDRYWKSYSDSFNNLGIWRFVNKDDLVPRLPVSAKEFYHCGHTLQLYIFTSHAYYLHRGDKSLGYKGVPRTWELSGFKLMPEAVAHHMIGSYLKYFRTKSLKHSRYYPTHFATKSFAEESYRYHGKGVFTALE